MHLEGCPFIDLVKPVSIPTEQALRGLLDWLVPENDDQVLAEQADEVIAIDIFDIPADDTAPDDSPAVVNQQIDTFIK